MRGKGDKGDEQAGGLEEQLNTFGRESQRGTNNNTDMLSGLQEAASGAPLGQVVAAAGQHEAGKHNKGGLFGRGWVA